MNDQVIDSAHKYYLEILKPQHEEFFAAPATLRGAFNLATALFHFHEWLYEFHKADLEAHFGTKLPTKGAFWARVESADSKFGYVRDLANASKHVRLTQRPSTDVHHVANTSFQVAAFDSASFDSSAFETGGIKMKEGNAHISFDECAKGLFRYWSGLVHILRLER